MLDPAAAILAVSIISSFATLLYWPLTINVSAKKSFKQLVSPNVLFSLFAMIAILYRDSTHGGWASQENTSYYTLIAPLVLFLAVSKSITKCKIHRLGFCIPIFTASLLFAGYNLLVSSMPRASEMLVPISLMLIYATSHLPLSRIFCQALSSILMAIVALAFRSRISVSFLLLASFLNIASFSYRFSSSRSTTNTVSARQMTILAIALGIASVLFLLAFNTSLILKFIESPRWQDTYGLIGKNFSFSSLASGPYKVFSALPSTIPSTLVAHNYVIDTLVNHGIASAFFAATATFFLVISFIASLIDMLLITTKRKPFSPTIIRSRITYSLSLLSAILVLLLQPLPFSSPGLFLLFAYLIAVIPSPAPSHHAYLRGYFS